MGRVGSGDGSSGAVDWKRFQGNASGTPAATSGNSVSTQYAAVEGFVPAPGAGPVNMNTGGLGDPMNTVRGLYNTYNIPWTPEVESGMSRAFQDPTVGGGLQQAVQQEGQAPTTPGSPNEDEQSKRFQAAMMARMMDPIEPPNVMKKIIEALQYVAPELVKNLPKPDHAMDEAMSRIAGDRDARRIQEEVAAEQGLQLPSEGQSVQSGQGSSSQGGQGELNAEATRLVRAAGIQV